MPCAREGEITTHPHIRSAQQRPTDELHPGHERLKANEGIEITRILSVGRKSHHDLTFR